ncbi:MAG: NAD(P) transhydrogenase subunit alpha [Capsulimonadaceae bacterium]|nr:NAD(P) transhydrogenase subunit alpha [Capsulimonadaceae bacterium]
MTPELFTHVAVLMFAILIGLEVISHVPTTLHTPLMSATNAIHGIVVVGAIIATGDALFPHNGLTAIGSFAAVTLGAINVFGGFVVTERMLQMFKPKPKKTAEAGGKK